MRNRCHPAAAFIPMFVIMASCSWPTRVYEVMNNTHRPYRMTEDQGTPSSSVEVLKTSGQPVTIGFLEFDDQGELWRQPETDTGRTENSYTQLDAVTKELRKQTGKGPVKTVVFVHGWNHSASPDDANLRDFKTSLQKLAEISEVPIFGIYIGWRGGTGLRFVDVASREATAGRVAGPSLLTCLRAIRAINDTQPRSSVLAIGHSFGAKILSKVSCDDLAVQIGNKIGESPTRQSAFKPFADTIVLVNTAESGSIPLQLMNIIRDINLKYQTSSTPHKDIPLLVCVTSYNDSATSSLLPKWNKVARNYLNFPHKGGASSNKIQDHALFNSMGFYGPLRSHSLHLEGKTPPNVQAKWPEDFDWRPILKENVRLGKNYARNTTSSLNASFSKSGDPSLLETYTIDRLEPCDFKEFSMGAEENKTPFWFIQVPDFVSRDHNDVWNPNFTGLVVALESMKDSRGSSTKLAPTAKPRLLIAPAN